MKNLRILVVITGLWFVLGSMPQQVLAGGCPRQARPGPDCYDDTQSHPLRLLAYAFHPIGILLEWTITRPIHAIVSSNKRREYIHGHRPHPPVVLERVPLGPPPAPVKAASKEPMAERVTVKKVPVEKIVYKEVPKIVEVEKVVFPDIAFQFGSDQLTDLGKGRAYLVAMKLKAKSDIVVAVEGHTDLVGTEEYNQKLGLQRAETVMKELTELGIDPGRMSVTSLGETNPVIDKETNWARAANRRVEFKITAH